ncbi:dihydrolipoyl dehydrogenase [Candidatus Woesearchaeota archaeon]|nr:dihydrolipoyl dehydrogenase [Candidatus Woesearchaeota archaeon]
MYDAVVIGSGPGGYECARRVAESGGKAAIIEKNSFGGTCTNSGCIPTKTLHASASLFSDAKREISSGFSVPLPSKYFKKMLEKKARVVRIMSKGVQKMLSDANVEMMLGEARIKDRHTVAVSGQTLNAKNIVIATGAVPRMLPGLSLNDIVLTSTEMIELKELPSSLIIIGGGYIGCEFASIFASLGVKVKMMEMMPSILYNEDADISAELARIMKRQDIEIFTSSKMLDINGNKVKFEHNKTEKYVEADKILVAVGVEPYFNRSEMDNLRVKYGKGIIVNDKMQTSVENIYAVGDVTDKIKLAHYAYAQAQVAAKNIMGYEAEFDEATVPSAIFTIPEISSVGVRNSELKSAKFGFAENGKARAMGEADGFVKIYYEDGYLRGFCAIGPHASDLVAEVALAIKNNIPLEKISGTIHAHPTLSEAFLGVVERALKNNKGR